MSHISKFWIEAKLSDVCSKGQYGWTTKAASSGNVRFLRTTDITKASLNWVNVPYCEKAPENLGAYLIEKNDLLISRAGSVGYSYLVSQIPESTVFASYLIRFRPNNAIVPKYLAWFLKSFNYWNQISDASAGVAVMNVNATQLAEIKVPLAPLNEQKRIADKLDTLMAAVDACRARLDKVPLLIKRFRQSVLAAATTGALSEDWREAHGVKFEKWLEPSLEELCIKITDGEHISPTLTESGIPLVSAKDVREWGVDLSDTKFVSSEFSKVSRKRCKPELNDVLVVSRGATVGRTCLVTFDKEFCLMGSVLLFKPAIDKIVAKYLGIFLRSPLGLDRLTGASGASAQAAIYIRDTKKLLVSLPSIDEQAEIVRRVEALFTIADKLETSLATARKRVEQLTPAILAQAFRGELVAQDPNDEPASALLARITDATALKLKRKIKKAA